MIRISVKNISIICILSFLFFFCISCGGGTGTIEAVSVPSGEFQKFVSDGQKMTPAEFVTYWNDSESNGWTFSYYGQNGLVWPDNDSPKQIYNSKIINCYRISKLVHEIYPESELVKIDQTGKSDYDHYYLLFPSGEIIDNVGNKLIYNR